MTAAATDGSEADTGNDGGPLRRAWLGSLDSVRQLSYAIGPAGYVWALAAALLALLSLAVTVVHSQVAREMSEVRGSRAVAPEIITASNHLNNALIAVLAGNSGDRTFAQFHPPLFEWADAARRLRAVCGTKDRPGDDFTLRIERICTAFETLQPALLPALGDQNRLGVGIEQDVVVSLTDLVRLTEETAGALRLELRAHLARLQDAQADASVLMSFSASGFAFAGLILFCLVGRAAARHHAASQHASKAHAEAQQSRQQLLDAIEALPLGFALYDRDERLVLFNRVLAEMSLAGLDQSDIGQTYEALLDRAIERRRRLHPGEDYTAWRAENLERFRRCGDPVEQAYEAGQTIRLAETRTHDGGTVAIRTSVTALKRREEEARASERRYTVLVKSLADVVFSLDRAGRLNYTHTHTTEALSTITGYSQEELQGRDATDLWHADDRALLVDLMSRLRAARGRLATQVMRLARKDGSYRYVEVRVVAPEKSQNLGGELAMTGVIRDIHAQHELTLRLRDRMERLNSIVQSTGALVLLIDRDLRIVMANNGFLNFVGAGEDQVAGQRLRDIIECRLDPAVIEAWLNADETTPLEPVEYDNPLVDAAGERRTLHVTANPVRGDSGRVEHIVFLGVDDTERRQTELLLFDASRLATLGEMASGIAHEINQPLTVIRFAAESLQEEIVDTADSSPLAEWRAMIDEKCARMVSQTERAATIIRDLRGFARRPDTVTDLFDVGQALGTAAAMVDEQMRLAHIQLDRDFDPLCPPVIGHASRLQQVIINLLLNARDAILEHERGAGMIKIRVRNPRQLGKVIVTVDDNGPGIPERVLPRLFEPFFTTKPPGKGTGLGLSISYQIIRQMGGTITAENRPDGGARFTITLDAAPMPMIAATAAE